jgi:TetR/AcrR family transcriptional regulator, repressor of fatR-cypB operon
MAARRGRPPAPDRREAILDAALACFEEKGFHGTTIPDIAVRARVASGTIYHYFASKEALVNAVYRKWKGEVAQRVLAAFPHLSPPRKQVSVLFREMLAFALAHPKAFAFIELHDHASYLDAESAAIDRGLKDFATVMIMRAQAEGALKPGLPALLMELVFGAFNGMMRAHGEGRFEMTPDLIDLAEQSCWDMVALVAKGETEKRS